MASTKQPSMFFLIPLTLCSILNSSKAIDCPNRGAISVYWGQGETDAMEGTLKEACKSGNYNIVILESLIVFENGRTPQLNLADHCGDRENPCDKLEKEIEYCQNKGIQVLLSIGVDEKLTPSDGNSIAASNDVTKKLAEYLFDNFLSGRPGPLGRVILDGIDFADIAVGPNLQWDELAKAIRAFNTVKRIYLSAAPQCPFPDQDLDSVIQTGLLDYIWVEFFNPNPSCIYSDGSADKLLATWKKWISGVPNSLIFLGLPASDDAAGGGYIEPHELKSKVLPKIKKDSKYGGVMVWDRFYDRHSNYSGKIKDSVSKRCRCVCRDPASRSLPM